MNKLSDATVLLIDKDPHVISSFGELLQEKCKELLLESDMETGIRLACEKQPNLVLLEISVHKMDGYEICERLKAEQKTQHIPVVFFSSLMRLADKVRSFEVGGAGYIFKPIEKRRASDIKEEQKKAQMADIVNQIAACLAPQPKAPPTLRPESPKIMELLQHYHFKTREIEILRLYIAGYKRSEIATQIYLTENTVKWYIKQIFQKLGVDSRAALLEKTQNLEI